MRSPWFLLFLLGNASPCGSCSNARAIVSKGRTQNVSHDSNQEVFSGWWVHRSWRTSHTQTLLLVLVVCSAWCYTRLIPSTWWTISSRFGNILRLITVTHFLGHFPYHAVIGEALPCLPFVMLLCAGFSVGAHLTHLPWKTDCMPELLMFCKSKKLM